MAGLRRVAGVAFDGSVVTVTFGKAEIRCIKASYGDKLDKAKLTEMGSQQIDAVTQGSYGTDDLKVTMSSHRWRTEFMPLMPQTGGGNLPLAIVVGRSHPQLGDDSDLLEGCYCTANGGSVENSNKAEEVELTFTVTQIKWTNDRKTINQLAGVVPPGASGF